MGQFRAHTGLFYNLTRQTNAYGDANATGAKSHSNEHCYCEEYSVDASSTNAAIGYGNRRYGCTMGRWCKRCRIAEYSPAGVADRGGYIWPGAVHFLVARPLCE